MLFPEMLKLLLLLAVPLSFAYGQTKPAFTAVGTATTLSISGSYGAGHVAANSLGYVFYSDQKASTGYYIPHETTAPVALITGLSGGRNTYVDSSNNAYFPSNYSGYIVKVPYVNGAYTTGTALSSVRRSVRRHRRPPAMHLVPVPWFPPR
jgi:hypothetical protein